MGRWGFKYDQVPKVLADFGTAPELLTPLVAAGLHMLDSFAGGVMFHPGAAGSVCGAHHRRGVAIGKQDVYCLL